MNKLSVLLFIIFQISLHNIAQCSAIVEDHLQDGVTCKQAMRSHIVIYNGEYTDSKKETRAVRVLFVNALPHETEAVHSHEHFSVMFWPEGATLKEFIWADPELRGGQDSMVANFGMKDLKIGEGSKSYHVNFMREEPSHHVVADDTLLKALRVEFSNTVRNPGDLDFVAKEDFKTRSKSVEIDEFDEAQTQILKERVDSAFELLELLSKVGALDLMNADPKEVIAAREEYMKGERSILTAPDLKPGF
jgi:hypothetical protein